MTSCEVSLRETAAQASPASAHAGDAGDAPDPAAAAATYHYLIILLILITSKYYYYYNTYTIYIYIYIYVHGSYTHAARECKRCSHVLVCGWHVTALITMSLAAHLEGTPQTCSIHSITCNVHDYGYACNNDLRTRTINNLIYDVHTYKFGGLRIFLVNVFVHRLFLASLPETFRGLPGPCARQCMQW